MNFSFNQTRPCRFGFTIVELLIVIAIMAVMSSMALVVMKNAQEEAREAATIARIAQIESLLQLQVEDYEVRRLPIRNSELADYVVANPVGGSVKRIVQLRNLRRRILADIINAEMPRPYLNASNYFVNNPDLGVFPTTLYPLGATAPSDQGFLTWVEANYPNATSSGALADRLRFAESAGIASWKRYNGDAAFDLPGEYLYAILLRIDIDGSSAVDQLGDSYFGDTDEDGYLEVVDAWGDQMALQIWQVNAEEVSPEVWEDVPPTVSDENYIQMSLNGEPVKVWSPGGFVLMSPVIPREIAKFRFEVTSFGLSNRVH